PFYPHHADALDALLSTDWPSLGDLACATAAWTRDALGTPGELIRASDLPGAPGSLTAIWDALHPSAEVPLPVMLALPESAARDAAQLGGRAGVRVLAFEEPVRRQVFEGFVPGTST